MKKIKIISLVMCAVLLISAAVAGTFAYLMDTDEAVNVFTVGNVKMLLDETDVDENGVKESDNRVKENTYHLVPGKEYIKDPTVTVLKGSEEAYVRMLVTISDMADLKTVLGNDFLPENYIDGWDSNVWTCTSVKDNGDNTVTYEFRYKSTVNAYKSSENIVLSPLFQKLTVPSELDGDELDLIKEAKITVQGNAIQKSGFSSADDAWTAFEVQINK
ncbi:MAG: SipW-dependent-type signal peptide-containing protein [Acutalibacteraceae bacterium]|nr:SipW-dependent-type signal peptide-containing protein [Acutalibacteraceae bacterium]